MPRDLADVLHHLLPEAAPAPPEADPAHVSAPRSEDAPQAASPPDRHPFAAGARQDAEAALHAVLSVPIGDRDVVRAAFTWNLAVEMARLGSRATIVAPESDRQTSLWPDEEVRPLGAEIVWVPAQDLAGLARGVGRVAADRGRAGAGPVLTRIPPRWLCDPPGGTEILRWTLLLTSSESRDLIESYGLAKLTRQAAPDAQIGVSVHGARRAGEAESAYSKLADVVARRLGAPLASYGLLVDDLQMYRAIVAQRPIGLVHPQSPAARSLRDVCRLLLADARIPTDG